MSRLPRPTQLLARAPWLLVPLGLVVLATTLWASALPDAPVTHEGQAYVEGATRAGRWLRGDPEQPGAMAAWSLHDHHAPLVKLVHGASWAALSSGRGPFEAVALGGLACAALALALTVAIGWRALGPWGGVAAGLLLAGMPRFGATAITASAEPVIALAWVALALCFAPAVERRRWAVPAALALAVAFAADGQGVFLLVPLLVYAHVALPAERPTTPLLGGGDDATSPRAGARGLVTMGAWPPHVLLVLAAGPLIALAAWPLARGDVGKLLVKYLLDPLSAAPEPVLHGGIRWSAAGPDAPFGASLWWLVEHLPVAVVVLALGGAAVLARDVWRWRSRGERAATVELLLPTLLGVTVLVLCGTNGTPLYYKGVDRLLPLAPFAALLGALGLVAAVRAVAASAPGRRTALMAASIAILAGPGLVQTVQAGADGVVWAGALGGSAAGAARDGEQLASDAWLPRPVIAWLAAVPDGESVALLPRRDQMERVVRRLHAEGVLRHQVRLAAPESADHLVLLWAPESPEWPVAAAAVREQRPEHVITALGVPVASIYAIAPGAPSDAGNATPR